MIAGVPYSTNVAATIEATPSGVSGRSPTQAIANAAATSATATHQVGGSALMRPTSVRSAGPIGRSEIAQATTPAPRTAQPGATRPHGRSIARTPLLEHGWKPVAGVMGLYGRIAPGRHEWRRGRAGGTGASQDRRTIGGRARPV